VFIAASVMDGAREQHPAFDEHRTPESVLFRQVNRYTRELYVRAVEKHSYLYVTTLTVDLPLADFEDGIDLPAHIQVIGGEVEVQNGIRSDLSLVSARQRNAPGWSYPVYISNDVLYLVGSSNDWNGILKVLIDYNPAPVLPTDKSGPVPLPDSAERVLIDQAAFWMARRQGTYEDVVIPVRDFHGYWKVSEKEFLIELAQHSRSQMNTVREVW